MAWFHSLFLHAHSLAVCDVHELRPPLFRALDAIGATGEVISWIFDSEGHLVESEINNRVTSAVLSPSNDKRVIGIAAGDSKVPAIAGAIESGMINSLITNELTAEALLLR